MTKWPALDECKEECGFAPTLRAMQQQRVEDEATIARLRAALAESEAKRGAVIEKAAEQCAIADSLELSLIGTVGIMICIRALDPNATSALAAHVKRAVEAETRTLIPVAASLSAAISLLERGGKAAKRAAPSDKMFDQMIQDYKKSLDDAREHLARIDQRKEVGE